VLYHWRFTAVQAQFGVDRKAAAIAKLDQTPEARFFSSQTLKLMSPLEIDAAGEEQCRV
jgi:hypothetical protein